MRQSTRPTRNCWYRLSVRHNGMHTNLRGLNQDPYGKDQHEAGAKLDSHKPRMDLVIDGFPLALLAIGECATYGAYKYTDHGWREVTNAIPRYSAAMYRHLLAEAAGEKCDEESRLLHATHAAWCALARLQLVLESRRSEDLYP